MHPIRTNQSTQQAPNPREKDAAALWAPEGRPIVVTGNRRAWFFCCEFSDPVARWRPVFFPTLTFGLLRFSSGQKHQNSQGLVPMLGSPLCSISLFPPQAGIGGARFSQDTQPSQAGSGACRWMTAVSSTMERARSKDQP